MQIPYNSIYSIPPSCSLWHCYHSFNLSLCYNHLIYCCYFSFKKLSFWSIMNKKNKLFYFKLLLQWSSFLYVALCFWFTTFPSAQRISSNISCRVGLLVINYLSFCLSGKVLLPHFWRITSQILNYLLEMVFFQQGWSKVFPPGKWVFITEKALSVFTRISLSLLGARDRRGSPQISSTMMICGNLVGFPEINFERVEALHNCGSQESPTVMLIPS